MFRFIYFYIFVVGIASVSSRHVNFYRKDYTYVTEHDAFYKFHWDDDGKDFYSSFMACDNEGAVLFYPNDMNDWMVAKKLAEEIHDIPNVTDIFVGIHDRFGLGEFITLNGHPVTFPIQISDKNPGQNKCVLMDIETGAFKSCDCNATSDLTRPYLCRKVEDVTCPTIDKGYKYNRDTKKCYKVNNRAKVWAKAMETCYMEGALLAVPETQIEADIIKNHLNENEKYFAGFKKLFPDNEYYTVKGHKLGDNGYVNWYDDRYYPDHACGILWRNNALYTRATNCDSALPFICEMEVPL